jgi:hypothetical protein
MHYHVAWAQAVPHPAAASMSTSGAACEHDQLQSRTCNADHSFVLNRDVSLPVHTPAGSQLELSPLVLKPLQDIVNAPGEAA